MKRCLLVFLCLLFCPLLCAVNYETTVQSNEAYYNGDMITLIDSVQIENVMGKVTAQKALLKRDEKKSTKIDFPWIELTQNVVVSLPDGERLKCDAVLIDYTKMSSLLRGSPYLVYTSSNHEIQAEEAHVEYEEVEGSIKPNKIILKKGVRLSNLGTNEKPEEQYALADLVTYFPQKQLLILESKEGKVLFYDKKKDMQLSAKTVHASRNPETKKDTVQGMGDVRFIFGPEELQKIKTRFHIEEK